MEKIDLHLLWIHLKILHLNKFEQFQIYEDVFGFLFNFTKLKSLDDDSLQEYYIKLKYLISQTWYWWFRFIFRVKSFKRNFTDKIIYSN